MVLNDYLGIGGLVIALMSGTYFILRSMFMGEVNSKIADAMQKIQDERIAELLRENDRLKDRNDILKERVINSK